MNILQEDAREIRRVAEDVFPEFFVKNNLKWESNSRVKRLVKEGKICESSVIDKTQTNNFPNNAATVRMRHVSSENPEATIHIRGEAKQRTYSSLPSYTWTDVPVLRITIDPERQELIFNGYLDVSMIDMEEATALVKSVCEVMSNGN